MRRTLLALLLGTLLLASLGLVACGGGDDDDAASTATAPEAGGDAPDGAPAPKTGGKLTMLWTDDTDNIDPGITYYQPGIMLSYATQKPLYNYKPDDSEIPIPDLAEGPPQIAEDGKTVTVKIKAGVKFSPPVDRVVTSADVKYAIERGFFKTVNNGYAGVYFGDVVGAEQGAEPGTEISGITTPDDTTIVFKLSRATGGVLAGALAMPLSAPVPRAYAEEFDARTPSTYGQNQVATGPYMIENDAQGKAIGYQAGKRIHLVRNPNWDKSLGFQPAYLDEIDMPQGNDDTTVASRRVLNGSHLVTGDFDPPPAVLREASQTAKDQLLFVPGGGGRYVTLNTSQAPFDDLNVRKAVVAGFNRAALLLARGGRAIGDVPTHFLPPGVAGFEEAGGMQGPGFDFMAKPEGDMALAAKYFRAAGMESGKYEGGGTLFVVGTSEGVAQRVAEVTKENFEKLGFEVRLRLVTQDAMYTTFCFVPRQNVDACPNVGWFRDFSDPQTMLAPTFHGKNILQQNNSNISELDVPALNQAMDKAETIIDPAERATAWAAIDRQVTELAPAINYQWEKAPLIRAKDVNGVPNLFTNMWDPAFTSLR